MRTPLELIERLATLIQPPRHRYYGVLAPNAPLHSAVAALAGAEAAAPGAGSRSTAVQSYFDRMRLVSPVDIHRRFQPAS